MSQPASKRDLNILAEAAAADADAQAELRFLASRPTRFSEEIVAKRVSTLDLLLRYPAIDLPIGDYLTMLPPMRVRQYSISPSPLANPFECSITYSVLNAPSLAAINPASEQSEEERYMGVASAFLSHLTPGDRAHISVRPSNTGFKPAADLKTPMIMACAGSGLGPFRGLIMQRAGKIQGRRSSVSEDKDTSFEKPAKAVLYVGCRTKGKDDIHAAELAEWERLGAVEVRWACSRPEDGSRGQHIQDRMVADHQELVQLFETGARIFVCGSTSVGNAVRSACKEIYLAQRIEALRAMQDQKDDGKEEAEDEDTAVEKFFESLRTKQRYLTDVFT
jgi:cytochrome P450/NADPH-cytochrome P450 reductase